MWMRRIRQVITVSQVSNWAKVASKKKVKHGRRYNEASCRWLKKPFSATWHFCYISLWYCTHVSMESWDGLFNHKDMRAKDLKYNCHARRLLFVADAVSLHSFSSSSSFTQPAFVPSFLRSLSSLPHPSCRILRWNSKIIQSKAKIIFLPNHHFGVA